MSLNSTVQSFIVTTVLFTRLLGIGGNAEMAALRNLYELPYLAQFVTVNKVKFGFPTVDTEVSCKI